MGCQWHQTENIQIICTLLQTDNHSSPHHSVFTGQTSFLLPNQQHQSIVEIPLCTRNTFYGTRYLSHCYARFAFNPLFVKWVTSLTPRVTWCHRSRDHWNRRWSFPIDGRLMPSHYLARLPRYWASNISGPRSWPFWVTWRHQSCDH